LLERNQALHGITSKVQFDAEIDSSRPIPTVQVIAWCWMSIQSPCLKREAAILPDNCERSNVYCALNSPYSHGNAAEDDPEKHFNADAKETADLRHASIGEALAIHLRFLPVSFR